jgi:hypothetical protein
VCFILFGVDKERRLDRFLPADGSDTDELGREEYARIAQRLRRRWKRCAGDHDLVETASGEPLE